jgi:hypothetical protein
MSSRKPWDSLGMYINTVSPPYENEDVFSNFPILKTLYYILGTKRKKREMRFQIISTLVME